MIRVFAIDPDARSNGRRRSPRVTAPDQPWIFVDTRDELDEANTAYGLAVTQTDPSGNAPGGSCSRSAFTTVAKLD